MLKFIGLMFIICHWTRNIRLRYLFSQIKMWKLSLGLYFVHFMVMRLLMAVLIYVNTTSHSVVLASVLVGIMLLSFLAHFYNFYTTKTLYI